jgi:phytanoyl-CoA hydroxylase
MLQPDQIAQFHADGYVVLPAFKPAAELAAVRRRAAELVEAFDPAEGAGIFSTQAGRRASDEWFLGSADTVRCFYEEEAIGPDGTLRVPKARAINKIGHALHDLDPVFAPFSHGPALAAVAQGLGLARPLVWQSLLIFKQPGIGGEVNWHQDASFLHTEPVTVIGFWFALEDARRHNGCLWVQPGGHRGPLRERFVRHGLHTAMQPLDATPWPTAAEAVPVEVDAGTLVCFHGLLPHYSAPNRSADSRLAYTLHATDASSTWAADNWLQRGPALPVRGFEG